MPTDIPDSYTNARQGGMGRPVASSPGIANYRASGSLGADDISRKGRSPGILHDVQAGAAPVGAVANAVSVDEHIGGMQHDWPVGTRVDQLLRRWRHAGADFDG